MPRLLKLLIKGALFSALAVFAYFAVCLVWLTRHESELAVAAAPKSGRFLNAAGTSVYAQDFNPHGVRGTVLLVHGTGAWSGTWFSLATTLTQAGYRVLAIDLPPFGYSDKSIDADFSRAAQAERIRAVIDAYGIERTIMVGHSFGGGPALEFALRYPAQVQKLVLIDPAVDMPSAPADPHSTACLVLGSKVLRRTLLAGTASNPLFAGTLLRQFVAREDAVTEERLVEYLRPQSVDGFSAGLGAWAHAFACSPDHGESTVPEQVATLKPPLLLLWGEADTVTPLEQAHRLRRLIPSAELITLPNVGHIPHIEDPEGLESTLLRNLNWGSAEIRVKIGHSSPETYFNQLFT